MKRNEELDKIEKEMISQYRKDGSPGCYPNKKLLNDEELQDKDNNGTPGLSKMTIKHEIEKIVDTETQLLLYKQSTHKRAYLQANGNPHIDKVEMNIKLLEDLE